MRLMKVLLAALLLVSGSLALAQTTPSDARDLIRSGNAKYAKAEYESAIVDYQRVEPAAGEVYAQALYNIGVCYYELWRTEDAVAMYRKAIKARGGRYPRASYALGVALEDLKLVADAREAYRRTIAATGEKYAAAACFKLGVITANEDDSETAAALFKEAIKRWPGSFPASHNNLGAMLARSGRLREAEREFEIALTQARASLPEATHNLALCRSLLTVRAGTQVAFFQLSSETDLLSK